MTLSTMCSCIEKSTSRMGTIHFIMCNLIMNILDFTEFCYLFCCYLSLWLAWVVQLYSRCRQRKHTSGEMWCQWFSWNKRREDDILENGVTGKKGHSQWIDIRVLFFRKGLLKWQQWTSAQLQGNDSNVIVILLSAV